MLDSKIVKLLKVPVSSKMQNRVFNQFESYVLVFVNYMCCLNKSILMHGKIIQQPENLSNQVTSNVIESKINFRFLYLKSFFLLSVIL